MNVYPQPSDPFSPNQRALYGSDDRRVFSGKDAKIIDEDGELLSTVETFQAKVSNTTTNYQPLGSPISQAFLTGYSVTITITSCIIESERMIQDTFAWFHKGRHAPLWTFQSVIFGYDGSEERIIFRDCVLDGDLDLHNFSVGDIIKRSFNLRCNIAPELLRKLSFN